jgi:hypothetical protein
MQAVLIPVLSGTSEDRRILCNTQNHNTAKNKELTSMKKTAKLIALAVALVAGFGTGTARADEDFKIGADLVSNYVWRGVNLDNSPNIQPNLTYTFKNGVSLGAWGSYSFNKNKTSGTTGKDYRYQEVDLTLTVPVGPVSLSVVDYYIPDTTLSNTKTFDFSKTGSNTLEADLAYSAGDLSLLAAYNFAGVDPIGSHAWYGEASYKIYNNSKSGYSAKAVCGAGSKYFYGDVGGIEKKLAIVNTGISVSKDRYTASYVYNPISEKSSLVFMASF